jgi:3-phosphoshikimate 1-carboxyvinyltransferase
MGRVAEPLRLMGAEIELSNSGTAPLKILGGRHLRGIDYALPIPSAQVKSAVLLAGLMADGTTTVRETVQSRDHTERMLGLETRWEGNALCTSVHGGNEISASEFVIPGDFSSAAFFIVGALVTKNSELTIKDVGINPTRIAMVDVLRKVGASIEIANVRTVAGEPIADLLIRSSDLQGDIRLDGETTPRLIDEIPILAVAGMFAHGSFTLKDAKELRSKESDRIAALVYNLRELGNEVEEYEDGFAFQPKKRNINRELESFNDHRIAMAFGIAGLAVPGITIRRSECVSVSFPKFWELLKQVAL